MGFHPCVCVIALLGPVMLGAHAEVGVSSDPPDRRRDGPVMRLGGERGVVDASDPALLYYNDPFRDTEYRVPEESSPPYWLADDIELALPNGATEWEVGAYSYMTYALGGTAPYDVTSRLYRFDLCTSMPTPLVDWAAGDCCAAPVGIGGTEAIHTIPWDYTVELVCDLAAPVMVDKNIFMYLEFTGAAVAGRAGWVIAREAEVGHTGDFWAEDIWNADPPVAGCGLHDFGGAPYAGFAAVVWNRWSGPVLEMFPEVASGAYAIVENEIFLDCHDLPQCVQVAVYGRDWDPEDEGILAKGFQVAINCDSYHTAPAGTLVAVNDDCTDGPCSLCTMGIDKTRPDYIFGNDFAACSIASMCPDEVGGWYSCLSGALSTYADDHTPKYMNHFAFEVSADTRGTWVVSLDPRILYTQLNDVNAQPMVPLTRRAALITVEVGRCCYDVGLPTVACTDGVTACACEAMRGDTWWVAGMTCTGDPEIICTPCAGDADCEDGNACTDDSCDLDTSVCSNTPDYDEQTWCCDPQTGDLAEIDDHNVCTYDVCNVQDGSVDHDPVANGTPCDDDRFCTTVDACADGTCQGVGSPCEPDEWCDEEGDACIPYGNGDFEPDGDVDLRDFAGFQACFGGLGVGGCKAGHMGGEGVIDLDDYALFYAAMDGPQ